MTRSDAIPMVLFIAIAISVGLNPPEAKDVAPQSRVQQSSNSSMDSGITNFDGNTVVISQTNIAPFSSNAELVGLSSSATNAPSLQFANTPHLIRQSVFGSEIAVDAELPIKDATDAGSGLGGDFTLTAIYGVGGNVLAQQ